jgi:hypothetical protein
MMAGTERNKMFLALTSCAIAHEARDCRNKMLSIFFLRDLMPQLEKCRPVLTQGQDKLSGLYEEIQGCLKVGAGV